MEESGDQVTDMYLDKEEPEDRQSDLRQTHLSINNGQECPIVLYNTVLGTHVFITHHTSPSTAWYGDSVKFIRP